LAFSTASIPRNWIVFMDFTREVSVVLSTVVASVTEARTGRLDSADGRLWWRNLVDCLACEDFRPMKVAIESVEKEEDEDELEPWWWEMALARRACERVRDKVEAMAYTHTHTGGI
jgi:hypothetical protein